MSALLNVPEEMRSQDSNAEGQRESSRSRSSTPNVHKSPLDPNAGDVPVPAASGSSGNNEPEPHDQKSIRHDLNSAHLKKDDISRTSSPGMGTSNDAREDGPPNWQNQNDILDAASHGQAIDGAESHANVDQLRRDQHPKSQNGQQSGPTGLLYGERNMEKEGSSKHDQMQRDLLNGKVSRDGEGSAGLPFDAGN